MGRCLQELCEQGRMAWAERERGWLAEPEQVLTALLNEGFQECERAVARNRRDRCLVGGMWEGLNPRTGSVASAIWVNQRGARPATVFIAIDGELLEAGRAARNGREPPGPGEVTSGAALVRFPAPPGGHGVSLLSR